MKGISMKKTSIEQFLNAKEFQQVKYFVCSKGVAWRDCGSDFLNIKSALFGGKGANKLLNEPTTHLSSQISRYGSPYFCAIWLISEHEKLDIALLVTDNEIAFVPVSSIDGFSKVSVYNWGSKSTIEKTILMQEAAIMKTKLESIFLEASDKISLSETDFHKFAEHKVEQIQSSDIIDDLVNFLDINRSTESSAVVKSRVGQGQFRKDLIEYWGQCAVTGCDIHYLLRASHIKPWAESDDRERLDVHNGLLLIPGLDLAFDAGLITFLPTGEMQISKALPVSKLAYLGVYQVEQKIKGLQKKHAQYLEYHKQYVFERWLK